MLHLAICTCIFNTTNTKTLSLWRTPFLFAMVTDCPICLYNAYIDYVAPITHYSNRTKAFKGAYPL